MEFLLGGVAACGAGFFTNPLEVVKTRMQLQGELKARGHYTVHYRNVFHAFYAVGRYDGIFALQKGLVPALWYQFFMNGFRLGAFQVISNMGWTKDKNGNVSLPRCVLAGAFSGCVGASVGSPMYMVKTHLQAMSTKEIAVGYQHHHSGMSSALSSIFKEHGVLGLWRGVSGAVARVSVGSASQLSTFAFTKDKIVKSQVFPKDSWLNGFSASLCSSVIVVLFMTPFDVVSTRLYNQGTDSTGKGLYYKGVTDAFLKIYKKEGVWGFYKGWGASLFRLGPHTILSLVFWDRTRALYFSFQEKSKQLE